jgi:molybdopterin synthase catalytic subunit
VFPIVLAVQKLSGVGANSIFMGVVRNRVDDDPNMVKVGRGWRLEAYKMYQQSYDFPNVLL